MTSSAAGPSIMNAGDRALLVDVREHGTLLRLVNALRRNPIEGVQDILPAANTLLLTLLSPKVSERVRREIDGLLRGLAESGVAAVSRETLQDNDFAEEPLAVPVRYDGADLAEAARLLDLGPEELIAAHTGTIWRCAFVGFAPGFGYLEPPDGRLSVPRRAAARTAIPAGAVGLAGGYSAVYPRSTPGGWQLIGTAEATMWDVERDPPALIRAGARVRFFDVAAPR
ncbi:5-oxoprolinase subunit B family protein [Nocardia callitridis]|uniref:Allophanate hydrolase subunit 1 n=1 Tax=Nocardia callitridis TaxID=648753 RepID=A0ABP9JWN0_9NOCA